MAALLTHNNRNNLAAAAAGEHMSNHDNHNQMGASSIADSLGSPRGTNPVDDPSKIDDTYDN